VALKVVFSIIYKVTVKSRLPYKELIPMAEEEIKLLFHIRNLPENQAKYHIIEIHEAIQRSSIYMCYIGCNLSFQTISTAHSTSRSF
jgi:hypothetical protein